MTATGRRSKLTPERHDKMVELIRAGNYIETSAAACGITAQSYFNWMATGRAIAEQVEKCEHDEDVEAMLDGLTPHEHDCLQFFDSVSKAAAEAEAYAVMIVRKHMPDQWTAAMTFLERRYPGRWRRRDTHEVIKQDAGDAASEQALLEDPEAVRMMHEALRRASRRTIENPTHVIDDDDVT